MALLQSDTHQTARGYHTGLHLFAESVVTNYQTTAKDPIHDWPFHQLQAKITYKATEDEIPTTQIDPAGTSYSCRGANEPIRNSVLMPAVWLRSPR
jgi:transposase